jgi:hypothetical protein
MSSLVKFATHQNSSDLVQSTVQDLLANSVVTTSIVVGSILLTTDQKLRVEELSVVTSANLIDWGRVQVDEDGTRNVFAAASLCEDGIELARVVERLCGGIWTTILLETVLKEVPRCPILVSRTCMLPSRFVGIVCGYLVRCAIRGKCLQLPSAVT